LAGVGRYDDIVGIHSVRFIDPSFGNLSLKEAEQRFRGATDTITDYAKEMQAPDWFVRGMFSVNATTLHYLTKDELFQAQNTSPYVAGLVLARCGPEPQYPERLDPATLHVTRDDGFRDPRSEKSDRERLAQYRRLYAEAKARDAKYRPCAEPIYEEFYREGTADYLKQHRTPYNGLPITDDPQLGPLADEIFKSFAILDISKPFEGGTAAPGFSSITGLF